MSRKVLSVLLATAMTASLLVGCGGSAAAPAADAAAPAATEEAAPAADAATGHTQAHRMTVLAESILQPSQLRHQTWE